MTPRDCSSVAKSASSDSIAVCKPELVAPLLDDVVLEAALLEGVLLVELAVPAAVPVADVVVVGVEELDDVLADGLVAAFEAADPVAGVLVPPLADSDGDNAWASWFSPEEMALAGLVTAPPPAAPAELPVVVGCALAACCRATDTASNSAERNCVNA